MFTTITTEQLILAADHIGWAIYDYAEQHIPKGTAVDDTYRALDAVFNEMVATLRARGLTDDDLTYEVHFPVG